MSKHGNKNSDNGGEPKGPCRDCGTDSGPFVVVMRCSSTGKRKFVKLCPSCNPKVDWGKRQ